jgi:hypothetical protein
MRRIVRSLVWLAVPMAALTAGCASTPRVVDDGCELSAADSVHLAGGPVYRDCDVDSPVRLLKGDVDFRPPSGTPARSECFTAEVELVVGPDGRPETDSGRLVSASHHAFGVAVMTALPRWQFTPASLDGAAVRQIVRERRVQAMVVTVVRSGGGMGSRPASPLQGSICR